MVAFSPILVTLSLCLLSAAIPFIDNSSSPPTSNDALELQDLSARYKRVADWAYKGVKFAKRPGFAGYFVSWPNKEDKEVQAKKPRKTLNKCIHSHVKIEWQNKVAFTPFTVVPDPTSKYHTEYFLLEDSIEPSASSDAEALKKRFEWVKTNLRYCLAKLADHPDKKSWDNAADETKRPGVVKYRQGLDPSSGLYNPDKANAGDDGDKESGDTSKPTDDTSKSTGDDSKDKDSDSEA